MDKQISLSELDIDHSAKVQALDFDGNERRRMLDLGLREGSAIKPVLSSPSGNPTAYQVCGAIIALRSCDSMRISVSPLAAQGGAI